MEKQGHHGFSMESLAHISDINLNHARVHRSKLEAIAWPMMGKVQNADFQLGPVTGQDSSNHSHVERNTSTRNVYENVNVVEILKGRSNIVKKEINTSFGKFINLKLVESTEFTTFKCSQPS